MKFQRRELNWKSRIEHPKENINGRKKNSLHTVAEISIERISWNEKTNTTSLPFLFWSDPFTYYCLRIRSSYFILSNKEPLNCFSYNVWSMRFFLYSTSVTGFFSLFISNGQEITEARRTICGRCGNK